MFRQGSTNARYYDLFDKSAEVVVRAAERLDALLANYDNPARHAGEIARYEHEADRVTRDGLEFLHRAFVTPIEREEICRLIALLDDVIDFIENAARRCVLHDIQEVLPAAKDLSRVLVESARVVCAAIAHLRTIREKSAEVRQLHSEIFRLEHEGDRINQAALAGLFNSGVNPLQVLKWKEIIDDIEMAIDRCQDVVQEVEGIALETS